MIENESTHNDNLAFGRYCLRHSRSISQKLYSRLAYRITLSDSLKSTRSLPTLRGTPPKEFIQRADKVTRFLGRCSDVRCEGSERLRLGSSHHERHRRLRVTGIGRRKHGLPRHRRSEHRNADRRISYSPRSSRPTLPRHRDRNDRRHHSQQHRSIPDCITCPHEPRLTGTAAACRRSARLNQRRRSARTIHRPGLGTARDTAPADTLIDYPERSGLGSEAISFPRHDRSSCSRPIIVLIRYRIIQTGVGPENQTVGGVTVIVYHHNITCSSIV